MDPRPNVLVGVTLWRVFVAAVAWYGFDLVTGASRYLPWSPLPDWGVLGELSQLASLLVVIGYLGLAGYPLLVSGRRHEPHRAWLRGALAVLMWLVSLTSILVFDNHGRLHHHGFLFEHLVTPLIVTLDVIVVGHSQHNIRWWYPLTWACLPVVYFVGLAATGFATYPGLFDPDQPARLSLVVAAFLLAIVAAGYLLYGIGKLKAFVAHRAAVATMPSVAEAKA
jgi:hypothetical protein